MGVKLAVTPVFTEEKSHKHNHETFGYFIQTFGEDFRGLKQIERLLAIDLKMLSENITYLHLVDHVDVVPEYYEYSDILRQSKEAEKKEELEQAEQWRQKAQALKKAYFEKKVKPKEYWIAIADLETVVEELFQKLSLHPELVKQVKPHFRWEENYYMYDPEKPLTYPIRMPLNIYEDVFQFKNYLHILREIGHHYIFFYV